MSQHDFVINNQGFPAFRADLNDFLSAVKTTHSGSSLPSGAAAGTIWLDTSSATVPLLKYYDGADNILLATINHTTNTVTFSGAATDLVNDLTPQLGGNLDTNTHSIVTTSNANVKLYPNGSGVVEVGGGTNSGRIQLNCESNSHGIKLASPPHSAAQSYTLTFPSTAPSNGKVLQTDGSGNLSFASVVGSLSTPLIVTGDATAGSEIRLPEDTDNGSNYVALKAADSIASNVTFTLPSADGSSNQVLQTNGSGVLSFGSVGSDFVRLATTTVSSSVSEVNFTTGFSDTYSIYELELMNVDTSTNAYINFRWAYGGTPTYVTSGYQDFAGGVSFPTDSTFVGKNTYNRTTAHSITTGDHTTTNVTGYGMNGKIRLFNARSTSTYFKGFNSQVMYQHSNADYGTIAHTVGFNNDTTLRDNAVTGFKIYLSTGNIDAGTFVLYGIKTS